MSSSTTFRSCCSHSSPPLCLQFNFKFKSPPKSPTTVHFPAKYLTISSSSVDRSVSGQTCSCGLNRRRGLLFTATLPFLEFMEEFGAKAAESGRSDYMREEVTKVVSKGKAAGVLRLAFHDAATFETDDNSGGMNGSIVYELERPENAGLKKSLKVLEKAKSQVDAIQTVSWADMIAVGGAVAVSVCGGPSIYVSLGRLDSIEPDPEGKLPEESLDASGLKQCFQRKGFSIQDLVALSGAHTLGSKGFGNPTVFDNSYFKILLEKPWQSSGGMSSMIGLPSDRALVEDDECLSPQEKISRQRICTNAIARRWIRKYANNQDLFFEDFKNAYIKLVNTGARWKSL